MTHTLYKFVSNHDYILKDGYIRASQLNALNDPFEAVYCKDSLTKLSKEFENKDLIDINIIEKDKHKIGVISFTEAKDNLLMWAHYADEYKGSLIGISRIEYLESSIFYDLFPYSDYNLLFNYPHLFNGKIIPVSYRKQPMYKIDKFDRDYSNIDATGNNQILYEIFHQKSEEWIYEKEHRVILRLEQADKVIIEKLNNKELNRIKELYNESEIFEEKEKSSQVIFYLDKIKDNETRFQVSSILTKYSKNPNNIYLFKLCPHAICSLTFGNKANSFDYTKYLDFDSKGYFDVYKTKIDKSTYTLEFKKLYSKW